MARHTLEYPKTPTNSVNRYKAHAVYDLATIHRLINATQVLHVSFATPSQPFPVTLPMIGQMGSFERPSADLGDPMDLYLHGYVSSRLMNSSRASTSDEQNEDEKGLPVTVAASQVDGLVLTLTSYSHNYNYRSAIIFGYATVVEDEEEKLFAMELITNSVVPDRWRHTRIPPTRAEQQSTSILRVRVSSASGKVSAGQAKDDKADMENEEMLNSTWTGVLPVYQVIGEPVAGPYNRVEFPEYIESFLQDFNGGRKEVAMEAATGERRKT